jgi:CheY-like chemotaxis protein
MADAESSRRCRTVGRMRNSRSKGYTGTWVKAATNPAAADDDDMSDQTAGRTAIIADRHALGRNLVRFLLEEEGFEISAEAATIAEVLLAVQHQTPDVLVVHENLARDHDPAVFSQIRQLSPNTSLVLMTGNCDNLAVELIFIADSIVEEGPGLGQLAFAAGWQAPTEAQRVDVERAARVRRTAQRRWRPPWGERLDTRGAVAASIVVFAVMLGRATGFGPFPDADAPGSPRPSIRAEGSATGDAPSASTPIAFELASSTSPAEDDRSTGRSDREPTPDAKEGPAPEPGEEPGPGPTEDPPPGPDQQPPPDPPASDDSDPQVETVVDEVVAPVGDGVEDVVDDVVGEVDVVVDEVVDGAEAVVDDAVETVDDVVGEVGEVVEDADDVVGEVVEDTDDLVEGVLGGGPSISGLG